MRTAAPTFTAEQKAEPTGTVYGVPVGADAFLSLGCMEGLYGGIVTPARPGARPTEGVDAAWPGYACAGFVALFAYLIHYLPVAPFTISGSAGLRHPVSAAIIAILLGLAVRNVVGLPATVRTGCKRVVKTAIPAAIVLTGAGLNLVHLGGIGLSALLVTVCCVAFALAAGFYIARAWGLRSRTAMLLGAGTGICGNSAIVAVAPLIEAEDEDVALAIGAVNLLGLVAMLCWPLVGAWLELSDAVYGVWAGASIHAVPQVVAAGFAYSTDAGTTATLVKLVRVALLAPMVFLFVFLHARQRVSQGKADPAVRIRYLGLVPWFVWGFVALAGMNTLGLFPTLHFDLALPLGGSAGPARVAVGPLLTDAGTLLLTLAMAAIGLELNIRQLAGVGARAIGAGALSTAALGATALVLITALA